MPSLSSGGPLSTIGGRLMHPELEEISMPSGKNLRRFRNERIRKAVDEALSLVSKDNPVAVIGHVSNDGWKLSAVARRGDEWSVMVAMYQDWDGGDFRAEGSVVWTPS